MSLSVFDIGGNDADTFVLTQLGGVERQVVIAYIQPFGSGIVFVVGGSARVCLFAEARCLLSTDSIAVHQLFDTVLLIRVDKDSDQIGTVAQDVLPASADDDAGFLQIRDTPNNLRLKLKELLLCQSVRLRLRKQGSLGDSMLSQ